MAASVNINDILSQVKELNKDDQHNLLHRLAHLLKKNEAEKNAPKHLISLSGLGSEIWKNIDIDTYIEEERQW
jgi:RecB family exonuclease